MKKLMALMLSVLILLSLSGCANKNEPTPQTTTTTQKAEQNPDWSAITKDGLNEELFAQKLDKDVLEDVAEKLQNLCDEEAAEEEANPEIVITEGYPRVFRKQQYKDVIAMGEKAEMPLYYIIHKSENNGMYEHICATALCELTGLTFEDANGWSTAKEYLELFNEEMASRSE